MIKTLLTNLELEIAHWSYIHTTLNLYILLCLLCLMQLQFSQPFLATNIYFYIFLYFKLCDFYDAELFRNYLKQIREETSGRLLSVAYRPNGTPNKWWLAFAKRKFMNIIIPWTVVANMQFLNHGLCCEKYT